MSDGGRPTLGVSLWGGQVRGGAPNTQTLMRPAARVPAVARGIRDLFLAAYPKVAAACRAVDEPGIAVVAVDPQSGRPAGIAKLGARINRPVAAVVGRHDRCDLYLTGREELSLRHMAIVLDPVKSFAKDASVRYRVLDLRTSEGLLDEEGRALRGLVAEGPAILRCGGYVVFVLPIGDPTSWPVDGADAWAMLPERIYFDEIEGCAAGSLPAMPVRRVDLRQTFISRTTGPRDTGMRLAHGDVAGTLEIHGPYRELALHIGHQALKDGVLLGRYGRCDATDATGEDHSMSRVHALLIHVEDRLLLVDTASTNGTRVNGQAARLVILERDTELLLGKKTYVRWRWTS